LFVHHSDLKIEGFRVLYKDQVVSFVSDVYNGRPKAIEVMVEEAAPAEKATPWWEKKNAQKNGGPPAAAQR
jgi:hypothetical protein